MAALFVMYIPCDDSDEPDNAGQSNGKDGGSVPEPGSGGGPVPSPTFTVDGEGPGDKGTQEEDDGASLKLSPLHRARLTERRGSEQLPLLAVSNQSAAKLSGHLPATGSLRSLSGGNKNDVPVRKFTVSKVSDSSDVVGMTLPRTGPNGSSGAEVKDHVHDISTEVITLKEVGFEVHLTIIYENALQ